MELKLDWANPEWWLWTVTLVLLGLGILDQHWAFNLAILVSVGHAGYFYWKSRSWKDFATQVRIAYLVLLLVANMDSSELLFLLMFLYTTLVVIFNQPLLEQALKRMPWNQGP